MDIIIALLGLAIVGLLIYAGHLAGRVDDLQRAATDAADGIGKLCDAVGIRRDPITQMPVTKDGEPIWIETYWYGLNRRVQEALRSIGDAHRRISDDGKRIFALADHAGVDFSEAGGQVTCEPRPHAVSVWRTDTTGKVSIVGNTSTGSGIAVTATQTPKPKPKRKPRPKPTNDAKPTRKGGKR